SAACVADIADPGAQGIGKLHGLILLGKGFLKFRERDSGFVLKVSGVDKEIYSIVVTGGHGYLRLTGTEVSGIDIEGAWLNLDNQIIQRVNDKLLVAAPEGDYTLQIIGQGANDERQITIERGKETVIDTTTIKLETPDETEVTILVEPEEAEATLEVDGEPVKIGLPTYLTVGVHRLKIKADGYLTQTQYLNVGSKKHATVTLELEEDPDYAADAATTASTASSADTADTASSADTADTANTASSGASGATTGATLVDASGNSISGTGATDAANAAAGTTTVSVIDVSGNETQRTTMPGYEIRVEAPSSAEFYLDDNYMGIVPCSFVKTTGQHTVTLRREGYETRSYNIFIDNAQSDKNYVFPELNRVEE
ncbi:MAG: PEGA domain-containing protein, partial [Lachnospiraceae bacterium]|nr:PEGA domain-containing protein [Lachnospiraceae bacterium]